jgi:hypothetical protein
MLDSKLECGNGLTGPGTGASFDGLHAVNCSSPHVFEVIGLPQDTAVDYPGAAVLKSFADHHCAAAFSENAHRPFDEARDGYFWFERTAWRNPPVGALVL